MIEQAVIHLLIPIRFDSACFDKLGEDYRTPSKMRMRELARKGIKDQKENFDYYFRLQPIRETMALSGSPFTDRIDDLLVKRVVMTGPGRTQIGIYQNEDYTYRLSINGTSFSIGRIKIYFFSFGIGMIQIILETDKQTKEEMIPLCGLLSDILKKNKAKFTYEMPIGPEEKEDKSTSLYQMLTRLLAMQSYVPLKEFKGYTFNKAYQLVYLTGSIPEEDRTLFFDTLRNQRSRCLQTASTDISSHIFPAFPHITWVTGDRSLICLGNLDICDQRSRKFLTAPDGMRASVSENYATIYAYCIARQLLFRSMVEYAGEEKKEEGLRILRNLPQGRFSTESHINELFDEYLWNRQWDLPQRIHDQEENCARNRQVLFRKEWDTEREYQHKSFDQLVKNDQTIIEISEKNRQDLKYLVDFIQNELPAQIQELRKEFLKSNQGLDEESSDQLIREFIQKVTDSIEKRTLLNNVLVKRETLRLQNLLGEIWPSLMESTRNALISAAVLWESSQNICSDSFDYSGICICTVSALEGEAGRLFFHGRNTYQNSIGKDPSTQKYFTMGSLVYLFGCKSISPEKNVFYVHRKESDDSVKERKDMRRYLSKITAAPYQSDPLTVFMEPQKDSFLDHFEWIRIDYRNRAAHTVVMSREETNRCRELVLGKSGEDKGMLVEMYEKVDFEKLRKVEMDG